MKEYKFKFGAVRDETYSLGYTLNGYPYQWKEIKEMDEPFKIYSGDCLKSMKKLESNSVDSIVTDPPYGLSFMGKEWDYDVPKKKLWKEALRVLKPGGHLVAFFGSRTYHRGCVAIEDAGFEIRDQIMWVYGSGFPKSYNIGKAYDKQVNKNVPDKQRFTEGLTAEGDNWRHTNGKLYRKLPDINGQIEVGAQNGRQSNTPVYEEILPKVSNQFEGWGTALKPSHEPIVLARKPLEGNTLKNAIEYGTGGINIDACRVPTEETIQINKLDNGASPFGAYEGQEGYTSENNTEGRFPANLIHDGSDEVLEHFPTNNNQGHWAKTEVSGFGEFGGGKSEYKGVGKKESKPKRSEDEPRGIDGTWNASNSGFKNKQDAPRNIKDNGSSTARFFYCAKVGKKERNEGLDKLPSVATEYAGTAQPNRDIRPQHPVKNNHPTVKPKALMAYLCKLITPAGGVVLDPFMGSGSTGKAAVSEGFRFIGCEMDKDYIKIAKERIQWEIDNGN